MSIADWMTTDIWRGVTEFAEQYPTLDERAVAERFVRAMSAEQRRSTLVGAVLDIVASHRSAQERARVRAIEVAATQAERFAEFEAQRLDRLADYEAHPSLAPRNTRAYKRWAATDEGRRRVAELKEVADAEAERDRLYAEDPRAWHERYGVVGMLREFEETVRLKVTTELLAATFAVGDGRSVTWGEATIGDHMTRIGMLGRQMSGTADAIARHEAAMALITEAGTTCLNGIQVAA